MPLRTATCFVLAGILLYAGRVDAQNRHLRILGTKIYSETELMDTLNLQRFYYGMMTGEKVIETVTEFYQARGYTLALVYTVADTDSELTLFVDEGRIGKIIFFNMDDLTTIYLKIRFQLKEKIYNTEQIQDNVEKLKRAHGWNNINHRLREVPDYNASVFQLDRRLKVPFLGKLGIPFFDLYQPRYDLIILVSKRANPLVLDDKSSIPIKEGDEHNASLDDIDPTDAESLKIDKDMIDELIRTKKIKLYKFDYGLRIHYYKGFIPYFRYNHLSAAAKGDLLSMEASCGVMYGINGKIDKVPWLTYYQFNALYFLPPVFRGIFTPHVSVGLLGSRTSRPDLGLLQYNYIMLNTMVAPGVTLLQRFNLYTGFGVETVFFNRSKVNWFSLLNTNVIDILTKSESMQYMEYQQRVYHLYRNIEERIDVYNYLEVGTIFDFSKIRPYEQKRNRLRKDITAIYDFYFLKQTFHQIRLLGNLDWEFKDKSVYSGKVFYTFVFGSAPFTHESYATNAAFRGLQGSTYFTRHVGSVSNEYRVSLYRDHFYLGAFFDTSMFQGSGHDLTGFQFAFVGGPTIRVIIFDQFEFYLYYGRDYLVSDKSSRDNFYFNIYNKW